MLKTFQFFSILFLSNHAYPQYQKIVKFGTLDTNKVAIEEFQVQKELVIDKHFKLDSAEVFFGGANFNYSVFIPFYPFLDSAKFLQTKNLIAPGSTASFNVYLTNKTTGAKRKECLVFYFYGMTKTTFPPPSENLLKWKYLRNLNYVNGTIYFSGVNFDNVLIFKSDIHHTLDIQKAFDRCVIGSKITFERVTFKNDKGGLETLNTSFTLQ